MKKFIDETLSRIYQNSRIKGKTVSGFTSTGTIKDGRKCLQALNWAFEHSDVKIVDGLVTANSESKHEIEEKCKDYSSEILRIAQYHI